MFAGVFCEFVFAFINRNRRFSNNTDFLSIGIQILEKKKSYIYSKIFLSVLSMEEFNVFSFGKNFLDILFFYIIFAIVPQITITL